MRDLLAMAYRIKLYQLSGPEWIATERYDINAKLPEGVSPETLPEMVQALVSDRFGIRMHREQKEMPVYALLVGKPPLKLKDSVVDPNASPPTAVQVTGTGSAAGVAVNMGNGSSYTLGGQGSVSANPALAWTGDGYGISWSDYGTTAVGDHVYFARLDAPDGGWQHPSGVLAHVDRADSFPAPTWSLRT